MTWYCVYLTVYRGDKLPRRYIGSSSVDRVRSGYNGSVSSVKWGPVFKEEQLTNKHLFKTKILGVFETREEAMIAERDLQIKYDVVKSRDYMNESLATVNGFFGRNVSNENNPMFGKTHPNKGKKLPQTGNVGDRNPMFGKKGEDHPAFGYKKTDESKEAIRAALSGVPKTDAHKDNLRKSRTTDSYKQKVLKPVMVNGG